VTFWRSKLPAPFLFGLFFDPESGGDTFLRNVGLHDCTIVIGCMMVVRVRARTHATKAVIIQPLADLCEVDRSTWASPSLHLLELGTDISPSTPITLAARSEA
jgi:hypothetical protein